MTRGLLVGAGTRVLYEVACLARRAGFPLLYPFRSRPERKAYKFRTRLIEKTLRADAVVLSYPKSGRTWLEVMLSHLFQRRLHLPADAIIDFDTAYRSNPAIPRLFFTHDDAHVLEGNVFLREGGPKGYFYATPTLLLVRHPLDVAVSMYFQQLKRRGTIADVALMDYVLGYRGGLPTIVDFMNRWARALPRIVRHHRVCYEDLHADTRGVLSQVIAFLGYDFSPDEIGETVEFASFEAMKERERQDYFRDWRVRPSDPGDPESYKVRRGKVGGYRDYFAPEELARLTAYLAERLDPCYGYR